MIIGFLGTVILLIAYYVNNAQAIYEESRRCEEYAKEYREYKNTCLKSLRWSVPITIIAALMFLFVPTTKEALVIYGVGGTVDYLKENPTAKQLPDKCVKALDKWVDTWNTEEKKKE
jgi:hypothetical protein